MVLPWVETNLPPDQREDQPKGYTSHEVPALRAGGPSGRTQSLKRKERPAKGRSLCNQNSYLCTNQLFLLHNLFNLASDGLGNAFAILRIALIEVIDLQVLNP